jgi:hypothetical protein
MDTPYFYIKSQEIPIHRCISKEEMFIIMTVLIKFPNILTDGFANVWNEDNKDDNTCTMLSKIALKLAIDESLKDAVKFRLGGDDGFRTYESTIRDIIYPIIKFAIFKFGIAMNHDTKNNTFDARIDVENKYIISSQTYMNYMIEDISYLNLIEVLDCDMMGYALRLFEDTKYSETFRVDFDDELDLCRIKDILLKE